jgi:thymidylate synthase
MFFDMLVGVIKRGKYGERLLETIKTRTDFQTVSVDVPEVLPGFIEDPEEFVKELNLDPKIFQADLLILYTFHPDLTPEIVRLAGRGGIKAVIIPGGIGRAGSIGELEKIAEEYSIHIEVDEICCTLEECGNPTIDEFAKRLGKPELEVETKNGRISNVRVLRGSPCGATWHAAAGVVGKTVDEASSMTGLFCQQYPCRAVRGGPGGIHTSGDLHKDAMERALGKITQLRLPEQSKPIKIMPGKKGEKA